MDNNLSVEKLNSLGIYELRTIARQIGVYSPTTLKKGEIIEKIQNIITGKEKPSEKKSKQGRPAKGITKLNDIMDIFVPSMSNEFTYAQRLNSGNGKDVFKHSLNSLRAHETIINGTFKNVDLDHGVIYEDDFDFITLKNNVKIMSNFIDGYGLRDGDKLSCKCNYEQDEDTLIVIEVLTINGISSENHCNRPFIDNLEYQIPKNRIVLTQNDFSSINSKVIDVVSPLIYGTRIIMNFENNDEFVKLNEIEGLLKNNNLENTHISLIAIDELPEILQYIKNNYYDVDLIYRRPNQNYGAFKEELNLKLETIKRRVEIGKNEIVIVFDYNKLFKNLVKGYSEWNNCSLEEAKENVAHKLIEVYSIAKQTNIGSSLTICTLNCRDDNFKEISNTYLYFNSIPYDESDITLDLFNSYTKNLGMVINKKDYFKLLSFKSNLNKDNILQELDKLLS